MAPDCLANLALEGRELRQESVLGPKILYYDRPETISHFGDLWDSRRFELTTIGRDEPPHKWVERLKVDHIIGCAMWIPCKAIQRIGMFDERFFLNYEETVCCFRARRAGMPIFVVPQARVWHKVSSSFSSHAQLVYFLERIRLLWIEKNFEGAEKWRLLARKETALKAKILARLLRRSVAYVIFFLLRRHRTLERTRYKLCSNYAAILGWTHYFMRRFGNCPPHIRRENGCSRPRGHAIDPNGPLKMCSS